MPLDNRAMRPPFGERITVIAAYDGLFDLTGVSLYLPTNGRHRAPTQRLLIATLRRLPGAIPQFSAMVYHEDTRTLSPVQMPAFAPLLVAAT